MQFSGRPNLSMDKYELGLHVNSIISLAVTPNAQVSYLLNNLTSTATTK